MSKGFKVRSLDDLEGHFGYYVGHIWLYLIQAFKIWTELLVVTTIERPQKSLCPMPAVAGRPPKVFVFACNVVAYRL